MLKYIIPITYISVYLCQVIKEGYWKTKMWQVFNIAISPKTSHDQVRNIAGMSSTIVHSLSLSLQLSYIKSKALEDQITVEVLSTTITKLA